jgi:chromosome segregation ATPase
MRLFSVNPDSLKALGDFNTVEKTLKIGETEIEVVEVSFKNVEAPAAPEAPDFAQMIESKFSELEGKLDLTGLSGKISTLESELNGLRESLSAKNAEQTEKSQETTQTEEKKDEEVQELQGALKSLQAQLEAISKSVSVLGSAVAPQASRKEESAKSVKTEQAGDYENFFGQFFK